MADKPYEIERVPAGHFILEVFGKPLDDITLNQLRQAAGVTNVTPGPRHVIDVSYEAVNSDQVSGRVRGRIIDILNAYYRL